MKLLRISIVLGTFPLLNGTAFAIAPYSDNFYATALNKSRWTLKNYAEGKLARKGGKVNFTVAGPTGDDFSILDLKNNNPGYNESWEIILDVVNAANLGSKAGVGFQIYNASDKGDFAALEFYGNGGFVAISNTDDKDNPADDLVKNPGVTGGSIRISFDKTSKLIGYWYDATGSSDGYQWKRIGTFSPTGKGGDRKGNWKMNPTTGKFGIQLFGFSEGKEVRSGSISFDNFRLKPLR